MIDEEWKVIKDFPDYAITNKGKIKRITDSRTYKAGRLIKPSMSPNGYLHIVLRKNNKPITLSIHRLVSKHFDPNYNEDLQCNHKNGDKTDCSINNLEMVTDSENKKHAVQTGLLKPLKGEKNGASKLKDGEVWLIKKILYYKNKNVIKISNENIGKMFNISYALISLINTNKRWKHISL